MQITVTHVETKESTLNINPTEVLDQILKDLIYKVLDRNWFEFPDEEIVVSGGKVYSNPCMIPLKAMPYEVEKIEAILKTLEIAKNYYD